MDHFAGLITQKHINYKQEINRMVTAMTQPAPLKDQPLLNINQVFLGTTDAPVYSNHTKTIFLSLHGEIFNPKGLKEQLIAAGQVVKSDKIEDLVIAAFQTWGSKCFARLDGFFAIFIYDKKENKVTLARDRLGSSSLFWATIGNSIIFSTQLKGILSSSLVPQSPDLNAIASYFFLGYFPQDKTPVRNVNRLLPGYVLEISQELDIVINKYWSFKTVKGQSSYTEEEVGERLEELMSKAIKKRLTLTSNASCFLTDDIGSTAMSHLLKNNTNHQLKSFAYDFQGTRKSKCDYIQQDVDRFQLNHEVCPVNPDNILSGLQHVVWHLDEPVADPTSAAIWQVATHAKGKVGSIFSSLGSYEFLGSQLGHGHIAYEPLYIWLLYLTKPLFLKGAVPILSKINKKVSLNALRFFQNDFWALEYTKQQALFSTRSLKKIAPSLHGLFDISLFLQQSYQYLKFILYQNFEFEDYLFFDAETSLSNSLIIQYERLFDANNILFYSPFFDREVIEFFFSIPENLKIRGRKSALPLHTILEKEFKIQRNAGFPQRDPWFLKEWIKHPKLNAAFQVLTKGVLVEANIIDGGRLKKALENKAWRYHQFERLWAILILEVWFRLFINSPIYSYPEVGQSFDDFMQIQQSIFIR